MIKYIGEDKEKMDSFYDDLKSDAQYVGEDGDMVVRATSERGAFIKFKRRLKEDVGEIEASELSIDNVGICYMHLTDPTNPEHRHLEDSEWFVNIGDRVKSDYKLFYYSNN